MPTLCFLVTATHKWRLQLRVYERVPDAGCLGKDGYGGYHNGMSSTVDVLESSPNAEGDYDSLPTRWPSDDARWPMKCDHCEHVFTATATRQVFHDQIYLDSNGAEHSIRNHAPGMMWHLPWAHNPTRDEIPSSIPASSFLSIYYYQQWATQRPPIQVVCPNGREWVIDSVASNGPGWEVKGDAPLLTCSPSIDVPGYHGWLREGVFTDDCEGRGPNGVTL